MDEVTFTIACRTSASGTPREHEVSVTPGWQLVTPHDLDAERLAVALGGVCTCVDLADRVLPAVAGYVTHRLRRDSAAIVHADDGSWRPAVDVSGCCRDQGFPQARDAAAHLRRPKHWAQRYGASPTVVAQIAQQILDAEALASGEKTPVDQNRDPACPRVESQVLDATALAVCWDAGLHPERALAWASGLEGRPSAKEVVERAYAAVGPARRTGRPRRRPGERAEWLAAGVGSATVGAILAKGAYSLDDARVFAARLSRSVDEAAGVLVRWQASGLTPPIDTLVGVYWGPMAIEVPPPSRLIEQTLDAALRCGLTPTRQDATLALIRVGTPEAAAALLADPVRRPIDPYSP